jgi:transposase InsO family protein
VPREIRKEVIALISEACANGARKFKACELLNLSIRTLERWEKPGGLDDKRHNAKRKKTGNKLSIDQVALVLSIANSEKYRDQSPNKIVPQLADEGRYVASESTFYRILGAAKQLAHRLRSKPAKHYKPKACEANGPNQVWSWDITYLPTQVQGLYYYLYMIIDIYSRKIVGWSIHDSQCGLHASDLIKQACIDEKVMRSQLTLHSDNGAVMKGITMLSMLEKLGVMPSFSRPSVSDDNPYSESAFKTLKYHPMYPRDTRFESITKARLWCIEFVRWYNNDHMHSGIKFVTPAQRHSGADEEIRENRHQVYLAAKEQNPERWSKNTRDWTLPNSVTLNPDRKGVKLNSERIVSITEIVCGDRLRQVA